METRFRYCYPRHFQHLTEEEKFGNIGKVTSHPSTCIFNMVFAMLRGDCTEMDTYNDHCYHFNGLSMGYFSPHRRLYYYNLVTSH
ncbi:hypothetical protein PIB30_063862 [Stylosanthes scabra]|uniref:Uncharacterized protein n=1 Tax=Stylosanthes scabra TaxID=79078 RepID=A0ABU6RLP2_9FABA|nr:hypothetical protein [Stylosanthes scabra]